MAEKGFLLPFDLPVRFIDRDAMRYRLMSTPWGDRESGQFLKIELEQHAGNVLAVGDAHLIIRDAVSKWEESVAHGLGTQFKGDRGEGRALRLMELVMADNLSVLKLQTFSRDFRAAELAMFEQIYSDLSLD